MKVTATTFARRSRRLRRRQSWAVSAKSGAAPIRGRRSSLPGLWAGMATGQSEARTSPTPAVRRARRLTSALQLALELVEELPVGAAEDDLLGARLDDAGLVQPERIEAHGLLGVVLPPPAVRHVLHGLQRIVIALRETPLHDGAGHALRLQSADLIGLEDRPQSPLGRHRVLADEVPVGHHATTEILGPGTVGRRIDHDAPDLLRAELLTDGGRGHQAVDFALDEKGGGFGDGALDEAHVRAMREADRSEHGHDVRGRRTPGERGDGLAF